MRFKQLLVKKVSKLSFLCLRYTVHNIYFAALSQLSAFAQYKNRLVDEIMLQGQHKFQCCFPAFERGSLYQYDRLNRTLENSIKTILNSAYNNNSLSSQMSLFLLALELCTDWVPFCVLSNNLGLSATIE